MKPSWKDSPPWANWLAMDADGDWYWYEHEPVINGSSWNLHPELQGRYEPADADFTDTLERRP